MLVKIYKRLTAPVEPLLLENWPYWAMLPPIIKDMWLWSSEVAVYPQCRPTLRVTPGPQSRPSVCRLRLMFGPTGHIWIQCSLPCCPTENPRLPLVDQHGHLLLWIHHSFFLSRQLVVSLSLMDNFLVYKHSLLENICHNETEGLCLYGIYPHP